MEKHNFQAFFNKISFTYQQLNFLFTLFANGESFVSVLFCADFIPSIIRIITEVVDKTGGAILN